MLGVIAHDAITGEDAKRSFRECGLFSRNHSIAKQFKTEDDTRREQGMHYRERAKKSCGIPFNFYHAPSER